MAVYIIQCGDTQFVKIGSSIDPDKRRHNLQTAHYEPLHIIRTVPGGLPTELQFRARFRRYHVRREWYRFHDDMMAFQPEPEPEPNYDEITREIEERSQRLKDVFVR